MCRTEGMRASRRIVTTNRAYPSMRVKQKIPAAESAAA